jgi:hypothetical protein
MEALSELFDSTTICVPVTYRYKEQGEMPLRGNNLQVKSLPAPPQRSGPLRRAWLLRTVLPVLSAVSAADAVHTPIPGDVGSIGIVLAHLAHKPLFVRHCGNWLEPRTAAERAWKWYMERYAGQRRVMLATGGAPEPPSTRNPTVSWVFSTSLRDEEVLRLAKKRQLADGNALRLAIVCRQEEAKGVRVAVQALATLVGRFPGASLEVVGDGPDLGSFQATAAKLGVADKITFHGRLSHGGVLEVLGQSDIFVYPTRASEGFPKVVAEAMACGLPLVASGVSVLPSLLATGCGLLIADATPEATASAIEAIASDPGRYAEASKRALVAARSLTLEGWRDAIGASLAQAWGPLKTSAPRAILGDVGA